MTDSIYRCALITGAVGGIGKATMALHSVISRALVGCLEGNLSELVNAAQQSGVDARPEAFVQTILHIVSLPSHSVIEDVTIMLGADAL